MMLTKMAAFSTIVFYVALLLVKNGSCQIIWSCQLTQNLNLSNTLSDFWMFSEITLRRGPHSSTVECAIKCLQDERCITFMVNKKSKRCRLHAAVVSKISPLQHEDGFLSYDTCRATSSVTGYPCETDASCSLQHTECNGQTCQCQAGYSFSPPLKSCVTACSEYGNEFVLFKHSYIKYNNDKKLNDADSICPGCCQRRCVENASFLCKTVDVLPENCFLSKLTKTDVPKEFKYDPSSNTAHYQRQCGFG